MEEEENAGGVAVLAGGGEEEDVVMLYKHVGDSGVVVDHRRVGLGVALPDHSSLAQRRGKDLNHSGMEALRIARGWLLPPCRGAW